MKIKACRKQWIGTDQLLPVPDMGLMGCWFNSALREGFSLTLLYFGTITCQAKFSFSKGQLNTRPDLSVTASSLRRFFKCQRFY